MEIADEEVDDGKHEPREVEAGCEQEHTEEPGGVQQSGVQVRKVFPSLLGNVLVSYATFSTLHYNSFHLVHGLLGVTFRDDILHVQHGPA